jgi:hypothetical protein
VAIVGCYTKFAGFLVVHQKNHWILWLIHKAKTEEPKKELQQLQTGLMVGTGLTGEKHRSDRCATTQFRDFKVEDTRRDRKACVEAKRVCGRWASIR